MNDDVKAILSGCAIIAVVIILAAWGWRQANEAKRICEEMGGTWTVVRSGPNGNTYGCMGGKGGE